VRVALTSLENDGALLTGVMRHSQPVARESLPLFEAAVPDGFQYRDNFITSDEERALAAEIGAIEFSNFEMRGVTARRRVAFFGRSYDARTPVSPELPAFLAPLRARIAAWAGLEPQAFAMALINEYAPGAPIGWHRDAPQYEIVAGVSLLSACRMRFRRYRRPGTEHSGDGRRQATHEIALAARSAYLMTGPSRSLYEHHIPAVTTLRYSITFRTLRARS
jgi:alkylated DNA repair dioxygenase AlkB